MGNLGHPAEASHRGSRNLNSPDAGFVAQLWLCLLTPTHPVPASQAWKSCLHRKRKLKARLECTTVACSLRATAWSSQQVGTVFSWSWQGPGLTYDHVLQRVLGQPAVEKHRDEQVPKRWPEDLWCGGEVRWGLGSRAWGWAHPP